MKLTGLLSQVSVCLENIRSLFNSGYPDLITVKVKTGLVTGGSERIAFAIVPVEVHYPDRVVGIALLLWSMR